MKVWTEKEILILIIFFLISACNSPNGEVQNTDPSTRVQYSTENKVVMREAADPKSLNPITGIGEQKVYLEQHMFQGLLTIDFKTLELIPLVAKKRPEMNTREDGKLLMTYEIRPEAAWDNGESITAKDVDFTLKIIKNPKVDCHHLRHYFKFIEDIVFYEDDPLKFTFICKEAYMLAELTGAGIPLMPAYIYDPDDMMGGFTVKELNEGGQEIENDTLINKFAEHFNSEKFHREVVLGSGPYAFEKWETNQRVVLRKKENWWGDQLRDVNHWFEAYPEKIVFETISDEATALVALKGEEIDVMRTIPPKDFVEDLPNSEKFQASFNMFSPNRMSYEYIGINNRLPRFKNKQVRKALAHLVDVDRLVETIYYGLGERIIAIIHPGKTKFYNNDIVPYEYDPDKARQLLEDAGWKDTNGNETIDNLIDGESVEFEIELLYNSNNDRRAKTALIFQEAARKVGIKVTPLPLEFSAYVERLKRRNFDMVLRGVGTNPIESDPGQSWHSESTEDGSNYIGFGTAESDKLIEMIQVELNKDVRATYYKKLQEILHEEVPCIFLNVQKERIAIHKRFSNTYGSSARPGYWDSGFTLAETVTQ